MVLSISYEFTQCEYQIIFLIRVNEETIVETCLDGESHQVDHSFEDSDDPQSMTVTFIVQGKTQEHTEIDDAGNILSDCAVLINSIVIDRINVTDLICQGKQCYQHDYNGTSEQTIDEFYGYMGHNGTVTFEFSLPMYHWFLEQCQ